MSEVDLSRRALVFGASGLTGRHLVLALLEAGVEVTTATRSERSAAGLGRWLGAHGVVPPPNVLVEFSSTGVLPGPEAFGHITEIHNCAGAYRFGMSDEEARTANVGTVEAIVDLAAGIPALTRVLHLSGYRVGGQDPARVPWSDEHRRRTYRELGAYEASKVESDAVFQALAEQHGLAWTIVNPSSVIGHSETGESDQYVGLATSLRDLWQGTSAALPGDATTFVPVVTADHLARFMALLPTDKASVRRSYWVLDHRTPALPDLLAQVAAHYEVKVPRLRVPVGVVKTLPARITRADPETLSFLSSDRYPTSEAEELAGRHRLTMPDTATSILAWADHLVVQRFGDATPDGLERGYRELAGVRTFGLGDPDAAVVVLPGLPVDADTWADVVRRLEGARAVDLPGLGLSRGNGLRDWSAWLDALTAPGGLHLVGHSIGAAAALQAAAAHPERVESLTLVSPFFLQRPAGAPARVVPLTRRHLRRVSAEALAERLTGSTSAAAALEPAVADLRRHRVAGRVARLVAHTTSPRWRHDLRGMLADHRGRTHVITGEDDPLTEEGADFLATLPHVRRSTVPAAGHHPHLTHAALLADLIGVVPETTAAGSAAARTARAAERPDPR